MADNGTIISMGDDISINHKKSGKWEVLVLLFLWMHSSSMLDDFFPAKRKKHYWPLIYKSLALLANWFSSSVGDREKACGCKLHKF